MTEPTKNAAVEHLRETRAGAIAVLIPAAVGLFCGMGTYTNLLGDHAFEPYWWVPLAVFGASMAVIQIFAHFDALGEPRAVFTLATPLAFLTGFFTVAYLS